MSQPVVPLSHKETHPKLGVKASNVISNRKRTIPTGHSTKFIRLLRNNHNHAGFNWNPIKHLACALDLVLSYYNSSQLAQLFLKELKYKEVKRRIHRHSPQIHFSWWTKRKRGGKEMLLRSILVILAQKSTIKVVSLTFTNVENFLLYQGQHDYIINQ